MPIKNTENLSIEEQQFNIEIRNATIQYGKVEDRIQNMRPDAGPQPVLKPDDAPVIKAQARDVKISIERQNQDKIKKSLAEKADEITKDSTPEIKEKISSRCKEWQASDIYGTYKNIKEKTIDESQEYLLDKKTQFKDEQAQNTEEKIVDEKNSENNFSISAYDPTEKLGGTKFLENKSDITEKEQKHPEQKDVDSSSVEKGDTDSWIDNHDATEKLSGAKFLENKSDMTEKQSAPTPELSQPEPPAPGEDD